mmetsp:Transcript_28620/g.66310  ORF Transcript_28620/g.66310 Transcript_28620/m.66310 type:complete len:863 (-) Transcript_28620:67-2655(-)
MSSVLFAEPVEVATTTPPDGIAHVVWIIRILLPIIVFFFTFSNRLWTWTPWYNRTRHLRETLLQQRALVVQAQKGKPVPMEMSTLLLVDETTAPLLFQDQKEARNDRTQRQETAKEAKGEKERERRDSKRDRRKNKEEKANLRHEDAQNTIVDFPNIQVHEGATGTAPLPEAQTPLVPSKAEEEVDPEQKMLMESLVNFVAFNRRDQVRTFLPNADCVPPPPPLPRPGETKRKASMTAVAMERANKEGQMVLRGSLCSTASGSSVARCLFAQLQDLDIEVTSETFELLVEVCIKADDLETTSELLLKMEASGHSPSNAMLDKVMEMYLAHKVRNQTTSTAAKEENRGSTGATAASSSSAPAPPSAGASIPPPPPPPPPPQAPPTLMLGAPHGIPAAQAPSWEASRIPADHSGHALLMGAPNGLGSYAHGFQAGGFGGGGLMPPVERPNAAFIAQEMKELAREERRKKLPAFSIPDEFAAEKSARIDEEASALKLDEEVENPTATEGDGALLPQQGEAPTAADEEQELAQESCVASAAPNTGGSSFLSATAAVFVPSAPPLPEPVPAPLDQLPADIPPPPPLPPQNLPAVQLDHTITSGDSWGQQQWAPSFEMSPHAQQFTPGTEYQVAPVQATVESGMHVHMMDSHMAPSYDPMVEANVQYDGYSSADWGTYPSAAPPNGFATEMCASAEPFVPSTCATAEPPAGNGPAGDRYDQWQYWGSGDAEVEDEAESRKASWDTTWHNDWEYPSRPSSKGKGKSAGGSQHRSSGGKNGKTDPYAGDDYWKGAAKNRKGWSDKDGKGWDAGKNGATTSGKSGGAKGGKPSQEWREYAGSEEAASSWQTEKARATAPARRGVWREKTNS